METKERSHSRRRNKLLGLRLVNKEKEIEHLAASLKRAYITQEVSNSSTRNICDKHTGDCSEDNAHPAEDRVITEAGNFRTPYEVTIS